MVSAPISATRLYTPRITVTIPLIALMRRRNPGGDVPVDVENVR